LYQFSRNFGFDASDCDAQSSLASALLGHARASDRTEALLRRSAARFAAILYRITRVLGGFLDEFELVGLRPDYEL
jgi:hypothetical protein